MSNAGEFWSMKNLKFANESLLFWLCAKGFDRERASAEWPNLSQFEIYLTDFAPLEVLHDAFLGYGIQIQKF